MRLRHIHNWKRGGGIALTLLLLGFMSWSSASWHWASSQQLIQALEVQPSPQALPRIVDMVRADLSTPAILQMGWGHSLVNYPHSIREQLSNVFGSFMGLLLLFAILPVWWGALLGRLLARAFWIPSSLLVVLARIPPALWVLLWASLGIGATWLIALIAITWQYSGDYLYRLQRAQQSTYVEFAQHLGMDNRWLGQPLFKLFLQARKNGWPRVWSRALLLVLLVEVVDNYGFGAWVAQSVRRLDFPVLSILIPLLGLISLLPQWWDAGEPRRKQVFFWKRSLGIASLVVFAGWIAYPQVPILVTMYLALIPLLALIPRMGMPSLGIALLLPLWYFAAPLANWPWIFVPWLLFWLPWVGVSTAVSLMLLHLAIIAPHSSNWLLLFAVLTLSLLNPREVST